MMTLPASASPSGGSQRAGAGVRHSEDDDVAARAVPKCPAVARSTSAEPIGSLGGVTADDLDGVAALDCTAGNGAGPLYRRRGC